MKKKLLSLIGIMLILFSFSGCGNSSKTSGNDDKQLVVVDWGGAYSDARKKANYEPFEKKYGVKIVVVNPTDYGKLKAMVQSGNVEWDVVNVDSDFSLRGGKQGLLEKLDYNLIKTDGIDKKFINPYGVGSDTFSVAICYGTNTFSKDNHPKNWAEFWDTAKYPGARTMWKYPLGTLESALLADGVKPENLYPLDVDRAFKSLDKIKKNVKLWWTSGAQTPQALSSGDVTLAASWNSRIAEAKREGAPVDLEYNQALIGGDSWVIPKGAKHKDLAMKFIAYVTTPEQQAAFSKLIDDGPASSKAVDLLPEDRKKALGKTDEDTKKQIIVDVNWWADNYEAVDKRFQEWLIQ